MMTLKCTRVYTSGNGRMTIRTAHAGDGQPQSWTINNSFFFSDRNLISGNNTNANGGSNGGGTRNSMASGPPASP
jgi:hypothetical protein